MCHPVVKGSDGHPVGEHTLQAHKEQTGGERHARANVVERLGMVNLPKEGTIVFIYSCIFFTVIENIHLMHR